jgi:hypothetical protein
MSTPKSVLPDDHPVSTWDDLVLFLGGSPDSFTGLLLHLIAKADPGNRARLRAGFPKHVAAWEMWQAFPAGGLTSAQFQAALASVPDR